MIKGEKIRFEIHNILYSIYKFNKTLNNPLIEKKISKYNKQDNSLLNNVVLNSMRYSFHTLKIIKKYVKKKTKDHERILLISAITQIVFLNFKEYAVINCSVEIAKKLKIYHGFINSTLKNIAKDKIRLKHTTIEHKDLPFWFQNKTISLSKIEKKKFATNFFNEPDVHIVFKNSAKCNNFDEILIKTSHISGFLKNKKNIKDKKTFKSGDWWVQDFSSFFPLYNFKIIDKNIKILDACAAPGGKSFQMLSKEFKVCLNDKSEKRINTLKINLDRLNFSAKILNKDFTKFEEKEKFDFIILDAPCSAIGTIRKNPEIFFKNKGPNFKELNNLQFEMLVKASRLIKSNGIILYMVCSFLKNETFDIISKFLKLNKNYQLFDFELKGEDYKYSKFVNNNFMITLPDNIYNMNIDGYFATYLKKI